VKGILYIDETAIGEVSFKVIDLSMGAIGGDLIPNNAYKRFQSIIQACVEKKGIANTDDLNLKITLVDNTVINPAGGIGVTDVPDFEDIFVEAAGIDFEIINLIGENRFDNFLKVVKSA
jgi:hypothetical protein